VVTGYAGTVNCTEVIRAGASDFISKPFTRDEFEAKLNRIVRERNTMKELEFHSICDSLTGLYNRRHFDLRLWEEAQRADRQRYLLYLAVLDVDRFKLYNDAFGHQAGDELLRNLGQVLVSCTRENVDSCFRCGGDEFSLIIPQASREQVVQIADRIIAMYGELDFGMTGLSLGLARFHRRQDEPWAADIAEVMTHADQAMYAAKADPGRQIVWSAE
jgi:diguanylate cyclase (GGDEF)-like protein